MFGHRLHELRPLGGVAPGCDPGSPDLALHFRREHDAVAIDGAQAELAHAPGLCAQGLHQLGAGGRDLSVVGIYVVEDDVGEVGVISQFGWWDGVAALTCHDDAAVTYVEAPARVADL